MEGRMKRWNVMRCVEGMKEKYLLMDEWESVSGKHQAWVSQRNHVRGRLLTCGEECGVGVELRSGWYG